MNSQSWFEVVNSDGIKPRTRIQSLWDFIAKKRYLMLFVFLPTLLVAAYYYIVAADQYQSEAHFIVSSSSGRSSSGGGLSGMLTGSSGGGDLASQTSAVPDYLKSHEAVAALSKQIDLVGMFQRPEADYISRLTADPLTPEALLRYYERMVKVHHDLETGITTLEVRAFRPKDAQTIAAHLLLLSEAQVNRMNRRRYQDAVATARAQVLDAQRQVAQVQRRMTAYRQNSRDVAPDVSGENQIRLVSSLKAQLATTQASLATMGGTISHSSPQYLALQRQVRSLQAQVAAQSAELTGGNATVAVNLGGFEDLRVQQEFAAKNYETAAAGLTKAQEEATRQQLYIVRVVDANLPVKSLFPQRERILLIVFAALFVAYGIGWLVIAGVKEHAA
ncbi:MULTISPECIES: lipopolysaccharide biosynthesis protein [Sphingobium]|uniref:lipopolysaccharide biosynthesis protein n=1 Tax=Sphingobium TaxID=165695 RepID=UPI000F09971D|nr:MULTISPECIES: lipopolysaccharide biosynthesis protein [Sphingobium]